MQWVSAHAQEALPRLSFNSRLSIPAGSASLPTLHPCTYPCLLQAEYATISNITNGGLTLVLASPLKFNHAGVITTYQGPVPELDVRAEVSQGGCWVQDPCAASLTRWQSLDTGKGQVFPVVGNAAGNEPLRGWLQEAGPGLHLLMLPPPA